MYMVPGRMAKEMSSIAVFGRLPGGKSIRCKALTRNCLLTPEITARGALSPCCTVSIDRCMILGERVTILIGSAENARLPSNDPKNIKAMNFIANTLNMSIDFGESYSSYIFAAQMISQYTVTY